MSDQLLPRPAGDDVIVSVRMRHATFERMTSTPNGRGIPLANALIGLVPDRGIWTFVVWSGDPDWSAAGEQIPASQAARA